MTHNKKQKTPRLRLVVATETFESAAPRTEEPILSRLCETFSRTTGWPLHYCHGEGFPGDAIWSRRVSSTDPHRLGMFLLKTGEPTNPLPREHVEELAARAFDLAAELIRTRGLVRSQACELAPQSPSPCGTPRKDTFAKRLHADLEAARTLVRADAVGLYLLDEQTQFLSLKAAVGLRDARFTQAPRLLRGAKADLEALTGHAVAIEESEDVPFWKAPEPCGAALCVPVSSATTVLGTVWCFSREARPFTAEEILACEVVAGKLAVELELEARHREPRDHAPNNGPTAKAARAQTPCSEPRGTASKELSAPSPDSFVKVLEIPAASAATAWDIAGFAPPTVTHATSPTNRQLEFRPVHAERCLVTAVEALEEGPTRNNAANLAFAAIREANDLTPAHRLRHAHELLLEASTGDLLAAAFTADVDPQLGSLSFAAAGGVHGLIVRPYGWEAIVQETTWLGDGSVTSPWVTGAAQLQPGDWLLVILGTPLRHVRLHAAPAVVRGEHLAEALLRHNHLSASAAVTALAKLWSKESHGWKREPGLILVKREAAIPRTPIDLTPNGIAEVLGTPAWEH